MSSPCILALNCGSSSLKFALFAPNRGEMPLARGSVERIGREGGRLWMRTSDERVAVEKSQVFADHKSAVLAAFEAIVEAKLARPDAVGHRLTHGGPSSRSRRVDGELLESLRQWIPLAPRHLPDELSCIDAVSSHDGQLPQIVCFDTALFSTLPDIARELPFPASLYEHPMQRYGFHGLSYESIVLERGIGRVGLTVLVHLGQGSSMVALRDGHLLDVHHESGLLGLDGSSSDMRDILERRSRDERAALSFELFCYQTRKAIGALVAALGGIDYLLFTGGIGEHAAPVRERICASLGALGVRLDDERNRSASPDIISAAEASCTVQVIQADEERVIARHVSRILGEPFTRS